MRNGDFVQWFEALEKRHLANLTFSEVRRAVQALSSLYVERRGRLGGSSALDGAGKRAAFALFFGPLHFLLIREVIRGLQARVPKKAGILDVGCGTGVAGAAWALAMEDRPRVIGIDRNSWVLQECKWTYQSLGISGITKSADLSTLRVPAETAVIAAFTINELDPDLRDRLHDQFLRVSQKGMPVLVIEPIARRLTSWWEDWSRDWTAAGGRQDHWRFRIELPERLALMDRAAGLDHQELTGRSLWLPGKP
jgi:hypothetical protein